MFEDHYEQQRQAVIDLGRRYIKNRETFKAHFKSDDGLDEAVAKSVEDEVKKLSENKYLLTIVGESKSGKSTFINAFFGKPLLPTGALQCTSGIIEIVDTGNLQNEEKVYLKVRYGDQPGNTEPKVEYQGSLNSDITPLRERLEKIAALRDDYRPLPTHQLNQFLLEKKPIQITDSLVKEFCSNNLPHDELSKEECAQREGNNPHKLKPEEFARLVKAYLEEYRDLTKIPVNIRVGYPVGLKFAHIRIVDTPGVDASGGLETVTVNAVCEADAVIVIRLPKNIASQSLQNFIKKSVPKKVYKNIFMFLTHKSILPVKKDVEAILKEAKNLYSEIKPERIIAVDSMLKQMADELAAGKSPKDLRQEEKWKKLIADYILDYESDEEIREAVFTDSNFSTVQTLLTNFSEQALVEQLRWVVQQIAGGYEEQRNVYDEQIKLIGWKTEFSKTPEQFDREIQKLQKLLGDYQSRLGDFSLQQSEKYKGRGSTVDQTFSTMKEVYNKLLGSAGNEDQIRKHILDFNDECDAKVTRLTTELRKEYENAMEQVGAEFEKKHEIKTPKINLDTISKEAKNQAYETITIPGNRTGNVIGGIIAGGLFGALVGLGTLAAGPVGAIVGAKLATVTTAAVAATGIGAGVGALGGGTVGYFEGTPTKQESRFSDKKHKEAVIHEARNLVISIAEGMPEAIGNLFGLYDKQFQERLGKLITERQNAYEQLKKDKEDAEKHRQLEKGKNTVGEELKKIEEVNERLSQS